MAGQSARIECVAVTTVGHEIEMARFENGLLIASYHPVFVENENEGRWRFPVDVNQSEKVYVDLNYNFVLS